MLPDYSRSRRNDHLSLLVVEDNSDHQLLISHSLRAKVPHVQPVFVQTPEEARAHLKRTDVETNTFPHLVLLDLYLPDPALGWQLLTDIRTLYPRLPVVILSSYPEATIVKKAYELGAHSFMSKPMRIDEWEDCFYVFNQYWFHTITLPPVQ